MTDIYEVKDVTEIISRIDSYYKLSDALEQFKTSKSVIDFEIAITQFINNNYVKKLKNIALSIGTIFYFIVNAEYEHENLKRNCIWKTIQLSTR